MTRALSADGAAALKQWEGFQLRAYQDEAGIWTIGYGHTKNVREGDVCSTAQADIWFLEDTEWACKCVEDNVKVPLNDNQFATLVSFCYNVGPDNFRGSTLLKKLNTGDYASIPSELFRWRYITVKGKKRESNGLKNRRNAEGGLWVKGSFVTSARDVSPEPPVSPWKTLHAKIKMVGAAITSTGISGASLSNAGHKLADLSANGWHLVGAAGIVLVIIGIVWGIFRSDT